MATKQAAKPQTVAPKQPQQQAAAPATAEIDPRSLPTQGIDLQADAGMGLEGADKDSYAIPFLMVLQPLSPIVLDGKVAEAKAGRFMNSVTQDLYTKPILIPCAFQRRWIRWAPRKTGGGFKGEFSTAQVNEMRNLGQIKDLDGRFYFPESNGSVNPETSDRVADTRSHFCLVLRDAADQLPVGMVFALASTGVKISKNFISRIDGVKVKGSDSKLFTPPSFSRMYSVETVMKKNDAGTWWLPVIEPAGEVRDVNVYGMAKAFHKQVSEGKVEVAHDSVRGSADDIPAGGGRGDEDPSDTRM